MQPLLGRSGAVNPRVWQLAGEGLQSHGYDTAYGFLSMMYFWCQSLLSLSYSCNRERQATGQWMKNRMERGNVSKATQCDVTITACAHFFHVRRRHNHIKQTDE